MDTAACGTAIPREACVRLCALVVACDMDISYTIVAGLG